MESSGEPGRIQISEETYTILKSSSIALYNLTARAPIKIKGVDNEVSTFWVDGSSEIHKLQLGPVLNNIMQVSSHMFSSATAADGSCTFPHLKMSDLDSVKGLISRSNSLVSMNSPESIASGRTSGSDITRIIDCNDTCLTESINAEISPKILVICNVAKDRLKLVKLFIETFGLGLQFDYAFSLTEAKEKILVSSPFDVVIVDRSIDLRQTLELFLKWLKIEASIPLIIAFQFQISYNAMSTKFIDFYWNNTTKEEICFNFLHSPNPFAKQFLTKSRSIVAEERSEKIRILLIISSVTKHKMISKQLKACFKDIPVDIEVCMNGKYAIDELNSDKYRDLVLIDNAVSTSVPIGELLFLYRYSSNSSVLVGLSTPPSSSFESLLELGCDTVWTLPLPSELLLLGKIKRLCSHRF